MDVCVHVGARNARSRAPAVLGKSPEVLAVAPSRGSRSGMPRVKPPAITTQAPSGSLGVGRRSDGAQGDDEDGEPRLHTRSAPKLQTSPPAGVPLERLSSLGESSPLSHDAAGRTGMPVGTVGAFGDFRPRPPPPSDTFAGVRRARAIQRKKLPHGAE